MTQYSRTNYKALYGSAGTTFPDNTSGDISEGDMRQFGADSTDSHLNKTDELFSSVTAANLFASKVPIGGIVGAYTTGRLTIPTASVLTANSSPVTLVNAPGTDYMILPIYAGVKMVYNSAAYLTNLTIQLIINGVIVTTPLTNFLSGSGDKWGLMDATSSLSTNTNLQDQPLQFTVATGNPTAGNSDLLITVLYRIISFIPEA
jgi:hypothetical protein